MTLTGQATDPSPYYWDTNTDRWNKSGLTIVSKNTNSLAFTANHLSKFAIFDVTNNLSDIVVYPNPYKKGMSSGIVFDGLSGGETIKIYTIAGESVIEQQSEGLQKWIWNTRNSSGEMIASGIYLYLITSKGGQKRIGKIAVIK
ncbi:MAG: T9SS type A sorting domain-containing protein [Elusimicrobiota bacterium]